MAPANLEGSVAEVAARLRLWCSRPDSGLARVEWDSAYSRAEVVKRLRESDVPLAEIDLPAGGVPHEIVSGLLDQLAGLSGQVISITGIEWAFPKGGKRLDTLQALSFRRETLAALPLHQIWWVPSNMTGDFVLGVPDLNSWFRLRLHLVEMPERVRDVARLAGGGTVSVDEARSLARRFWERVDKARAQGVAEERIWAALAEPAVDGLLSAGLSHEADEILARFSEGLGLLVRRVEELRELRGPEDPEVLELSSRLAHIVLLRGDFAGARALEESVLASRMRVLGEKAPDTLSAMNNLAATLYAQGDMAGARRLEEQVLEARRRMLGEEHPDTLTSMDNLAATLYSQGDLAGAWRLDERVLEARRRVLGEEHPDTLTSMNNLAGTLSIRGDLSGAQLLQAQVLGIQRRVLGAEHPNTLTSMNNLARMLRDQGDLPGARQLMEQMVPASTRVLGLEHSQTIDAAKFLAALNLA